MSSSWWYGVALFPVVAAGIASFVLTVTSFWGGILVALVVLGCLLADIRALGDNGDWSPSLAWNLAGLAHLGGAVFSPLLIASIPVLTYYLYRRSVRLGPAR